ncbi:hypothetical protein AURDEDRAFT_139208 [Auricularia subglabra TFB-10046 SS5]|nr:hypothetical protein AURDEDRAFT_139208 [Auricularia subglabra TFB-10046 SS5]
MGSYGAIYRRLVPASETTNMRDFIRVASPYSFVSETAMRPLRVCGGRISLRLRVVQNPALAPARGLFVPYILHRRPWRNQPFPTRSSLPRGRDHGVRVAIPQLSAPCLIPLSRPSDGRVTTALPVGRGFHIDRACPSSLKLEIVIPSVTCVRGVRTVRSSAYWCWRATRRRPPGTRHRLQYGRENAVGSLTPASFLRTFAPPRQTARRGRPPPLAAVQNSGRGFAACVPPYVPLSPAPTEPTRPPTARRRRIRRMEPNASRSVARWVQ